MTEDIFIGACFGGAFGLAGWLLWFVIFRFGRFPEHNDGSPCPIRGPHTCDRAEHNDGVCFSFGYWNERTNRRG
jgi:hypothetical protein